MAKNDNKQPEIQYEDFKRGWDEADAEASGQFVSLSDDGDSITGVLVGEPINFKKTNPQGQPRSAFRMAFWSVEEARFLIWEGGKKVYKRMRKWIDEDLTGVEDVPRTIVYIKRIGDKGDTSTVYTFETVEAVSDDLAAMMGTEEVPDIRPRKQTPNG